MASPKLKQTSRLSAKQWVDAALSLLADEGIDAVSVERLARELNVTKGSFYWHFRDRDALCEAMLDSWRESTRYEAAEFEKSLTDPEDILAALLREPFSIDRSDLASRLSLSFRLWARRDPRARAAVRDVDQARQQHIANLLLSCGVPKSEARARALLIYSYMREAGSLLSRSDLATRKLCEAVLVGKKKTKRK